MGRLISITDPKKRDAQILAEVPKRAQPVRMVGPGGRPVALERLIKSTDATSYDALLKAHGSPEAISRALVDGHPEIDLEQVGRPFKNVTRVYVKPDGQILYSARVLQVVYTPGGEEKSRQDFVDVAATVGEDGPALPWTGRLFTPNEVVHKFAIVRQQQLRHVNGLTFDFLYEIAKTLEDSGKLVFVGSGAKGAGPLVFTSNGAPFRGFLEGRTSGGAYRLVLHLTNLELKSVIAAGE